MNSACTIGIKKKTEIVYVGFGKTSAYKGKIRIATNKLIQVTVESNVAELDLGGYIAIKESDLDRFLEIAIEHQRSKDK